jgi:tetratricopeptide (TPR) repeat protein
MQPLYREAAVIPATGPLRDEVEKIRKAFADPKARAEQALQLVQQRIRYVALSMGQGGLVPATAETTWSRRFGDCKAKTALLLAILHEYGIVAEPVLANAFAGDAVGNWLPMIGAFNHVLVRAHVGGKTYYLDGTRTGDTDLDGIDVPDFGWVLPVMENAQLVHLVPPPLDHPESETTIALDASAGIYVPADVKADQIIRGDLAVQFNSGLTSLTEAQRKEFFDNYWKKTIDDLTPGTSSFAFDAAARQMHLSMQGQLKLDWTDGFFHLPMSTVGYTPDVDRSVGPFHDAPFAVAHPVFTRTETKLRLPPSFLPSNVAKLVPAPVHSTLIGVEYSRVQSATPDGMTVQTMTRSLVPEVSYKDAVAASGALKTLADGDVSLRLPVSYRATDKDLAALATEQPGSADDYVKRGTLYFDRRKYDEAISDFTEALKLEADNKRALVGRGLAYVWKRQFAEADKDLAAVEARDSDNDVLLRARGLMAEFKDDCAKAVELYTRALTKDPANSFAIGHRATCEAALSKYDAALADAAEALKSDPAWMELRVMRANIFMRQGKRDLVAQEAEALIRDNPKSDFAWVGAGKIYAALGQKDSALKAFDRALAINQYAYIYVNRAQVQSRSDVRARLADLDAALKLEPDNADALAAKAETLVRMGKPAEAIPLYDRALKAAHDDSSLSAARAVALYLAGRTKEAESAMAVLRSKAKTAVELNNLCWKKATARVMLESAVEECREALRLAPTDGSIADSLGMALLQSGKLDEALSAYGKAVTSRTGADSLMGRAMVYARKGDRVHAEADAAAARKLYPDIDLLFADYGLKLEQASAHAKAKSTPAH